MIDIILYYYMYIIIYREKTKARRMEGQRLDGLPSFPPRHRPLPSPPSGDKGKAEQKSKKKGRNRENQCEGFRRPLRPFLAFPSAPSDVFTVHIIAAAHHLATVAPANRARGRAATPSGSGRCYRYHIATDRPQQANSRAAPRAVGHPARRVLVLFLQVVM